MASYQLYCTKGAYTLTDLICILSTPRTLPNNNEDGVANIRQDGKAEALRLPAMTRSYEVMLLELKLYNARTAV